VTDAEFDELRSQLHRATGIVLDDDKRYLLEHRLRDVIDRLGLGSLSEFHRALRADPFGPLQRELIEALVITETSFFRDLHPWKTLAQVVLPQLQAARSPEACLTFWCAATSTGQEPYSLAMTLIDRFGSEATPKRFRIIATDISKQTLARAQAGTFSTLEVNRGLSAMSLLRFFRQEGTVWRICDEVKQLIEFRELDLRSPHWSLPKLDLALIRNVLIYFDLSTKRDILERVGRQLHPDGYLLLGGVETTLNVAPGFRRATELRTGFYHPPTL